MEGDIFVNKLSNRLDYLDKMMDLRNYYIESQKHSIVNEIAWLNENADKFSNLRLYFTNFMRMERIIQISDEELIQLAEIRGNYLYSQLCGLEQQKIENRPLKVIVQELKCLGQ